MAKEIKYGAEARSALESGVNQLANTVRVTLDVYKRQCRRRFASCSGRIELKSWWMSVFG